MFDFLGNDTWMQKFGNQVINNRLQGGSLSGLVGQDLYSAGSSMMNPQPDIPSSPPNMIGQPLPQAQPVTQAQPQPLPQKVAEQFPIADDKPQKSQGIGSMISGILMMALAL